jgi:hypothetical protein
VHLILTSDHAAESLERGIAAAVHAATFVNGAAETASSIGLIISGLRLSSLLSDGANSPDRHMLCLCRAPNDPFSH